jgi:hypothetical protein
MILSALEEAGGQQYLVQQAKKNPQAFMTLVSKCLPREINLPPDSGPGALAVLLDFIAGRARLATVPDVEQRTVEAEDATIINPAPTALLPKE